MRMPFILNEEIDFQDGRGKSLFVQFCDNLKITGMQGDTVGRDKTTANRPTLPFLTVN